MQIPCSGSLKEGLDFMAIAVSAPCDPRGFGNRESQCGQRVLDSSWRKPHIATPLCLSLLVSTLRSPKGSIQIFRRSLQKRELGKPATQPIDLETCRLLQIEGGLLEIRKTDRLHYNPPFEFSAGGFNNMPPSYRVCTYVNAQVQYICIRRASNVQPRYGYLAYYDK
ncbi:hypothetical protein N656DRAFT_781051 [Canariomyces notabilis]|uniref:Uncharacterized protein n=1 Tax=Canariomyces notabilis TaxID=2074819 RepID=A0AAN6TBC6_9PEZI|nr:hypothetical protein N656DRAFT_781051 [Canariomyces arenarius]